MSLKPTAQNYQYLFITILCAKMSSVYSAYGYVVQATNDETVVFNVQFSKSKMRTLKLGTVITTTTTTTTTVTTTIGQKKKKFNHDGIIKPAAPRKMKLERLDDIFEKLYHFSLF